MTGTGTIQEHNKPTYSFTNKTKDGSTMPQGSQHQHTGRKRTKDRDADKNATLLVTDVDEFADLDEKYRPTYP